VPSERRSQEEIRREIALERDRLAEALDDVREGIASKRRAAVAVGGTIVAVLGVVAATRLARHLTRD
jgi:hypothetical protein